MIQLKRIKENIISFAIQLLRPGFSQKHRIVLEDIGVARHRTVKLFLAAQAGDSETVEILINLGVEVNSQDFDSKTALMEAGRGGHKEIEKVLLAI